jgi:hypothetical protein
MTRDQWLRLVSLLPTIPTATDLSAFRRPNPPEVKFVNASNVASSFVVVRCHADFKARYKGSDTIQKH